MSADGLTVTIDTTDLDRYSEDFSSRMVPRALGLLAIRVQTEMVRETPVDTGRLKGSIQFPERVGEDTFVIKIGAEYWKPVQFGSGIYGERGAPITPKDSKVLVFEVGGETVFARSVRGQRANPFIDRAITLAEGDIDNIVDRVLKEYE